LDIYFLLQERLDGKVDDGTPESLSPALRAEIEREAIRVF
jgi:predicted nucleotidyltransferase